MAEIDFQALMAETISNAMRAQTAAREAGLAKAIARWQLEHGPSCFMVADGPGCNGWSPDDTRYQRVMGWEIHLSIGGESLAPDPLVLWARPRRWWSLADRRQHRLVRRAMR